MPSAIKFKSIALLFWISPRLIFSMIFKPINRSTIPPLRDEIELLLFCSVLFGLFYRNDVHLLTIPLSMYIFIHMLRGIRWQLSPLYITALFILYNSNFSDIQIAVSFAAVATSMICCILFPMLPPIIGISGNKGDGIGIQDICLKGPNGLFWVRAHYPAAPRTNADTITVDFLWFLFIRFAVIIAISFLSISDVILIPPSTWNHLFIGFIIWSFPELMKIVAGITVTPFLPATPPYAVSGSIADYGKVPRFLTSHLNLWTLCGREDAPLDISRLADTTSSSECSSDSNTEKKDNDERRNLPIVIAMHGLGGCRAVMSTVCMRLASEGFIVFSPEFADGTSSLTIFPDGTSKTYEKYTFATGEAEDSKEYFAFRQSQLNIRAEEVNVLMKFLQTIISVDRITEKGKKNNKSNSVDISTFLHSALWNFRAAATDDKSLYGNSAFLSSLARSGDKVKLTPPTLIGYSFGGTTALHLSLSKDKTSESFRSNFGINAVILYDPWMTPLPATILNEPTLPFPLMCIHSQMFQWEANRAAEEKLVKGARAALQLRIQNAAHLNFTEVGLLSPLLLSRLRPSIGKQDPIQLLSSITQLTVLLLRVLHLDEAKALYYTLTCAQKVEGFEILHGKW